MGACLWQRSFSIKNIEKDTFICSNHFIGCCGPTEEDPGPLLATLTDKELKKKASKETKATKTTRTYSSEGKEDKN